MRLMLLPFIVLLIFNFIVVDGYIYVVISKRHRRILPRIVQGITSIMLLALGITTASMPVRSGSESLLMATMWMMFVYISIYCGKLVFVLIDLISQIPLLTHKPRLKWLTATGWILGLAATMILWWGALVNRFLIHVENVDIEFQDLPAQFEGFRIVQISDIHLGTFSGDTTFVAKTVTKVNALKPDLIVFTGDLVNRRAEEIIPFIKSLSRLKSKNGVLSIMGNHDYGDYLEFPTPKAKTENLKRFRDLQHRLGWIMLNDSSLNIVKGNDTLVIIGVENIGDVPFPSYGSLKKAYPSISDSHAKILLTHNPAHWNDSIMPNPERKVALTLSGHTHAMQCEIFGFSPGAWRYKQWGGLYNSPDGNRKLYVNAGLGTVAIPSRIGATPEITCFTLKRHSSAE